MINLIWAMDSKRIIGKDNKMPWHCKEDLLYFKSKTKDKTVLLGYNNYISLLGYYKDKPLPYGKTYLLTHKTDLIPGIEVIHDIKDVLNEEELWVIGGGQIYNQMLPYADYLYVTIIKGEHEGNVFFPEFDLDKFELVSSNETSEATYLVYKRRGL